MADALSRRSQSAVILPFLRGGIVPTGANLDTARERQYVTGLYAPAPVMGDLDLFVAETITVTDRGYHVPPESVLVPVLIPSYRRRRMV